MKSLKMKDIANKTQADLASMAAERRETLRAFRFGSAGAKSKNVKEGMTVKKDIARIMTALTAAKKAAKAEKKG